MATAVYQIHDNGVTPYLCEVYPEHVKVIFDIPKEPLLFTYTRVLPGLEENPQWIRNTVLIDQGENHYIAIGNSGIFSFEAKDKILEYHSPIGNSDVPYPYAIGEDTYGISVKRLKRQSKKIHKMTNLFNQHLKHL
jgi:hypothetical protein